LQIAKDNKLKDGSTGIITIIKDNKLYVGNVGDSRGVLCEGAKAIALSRDHKPDVEEERKRIEAAGGEVKNGRIHGKLAVSRGFGDLPYKDEENLSGKLVTAEPDVQEFDLTNESKFLILACDGLWDTVDNQEAVDFILQRLKPNIGEKELYSLCIELVTKAFSDGSNDNISCLLVVFNNKAQ